MYIHLYVYIHIHCNIYVYLYIVSTLANEFSAATCIMQSSSNELSTLVADKV